MAETTANARTEPGQVIHFVATGLTFPEPELTTGRVARRGDELTVTEALREATSDRNGVRWLDLDEAGQVARWGRVHFKIGPFPDEEMRHEVSSFEHREARARAVKAAYQVGDPAMRREALARVTEEYGPPPETFRVVARHPRAGR